MHHIKKYANRKMYDTTDRRYISMTQLAELIKSGEEVMVVDNRTDEDLTAAIVSQLIGREKKGKDKIVSSKVLMQLLRKGGGTLTDYAKKYASLWQNALTMAEDEIDKVVNLLVKDKELSKSEGSRLKREILGYSDTLKKWVSDNVDRRVNEVFGMMNLATKDDMSHLAARLDRLERKIQRMESSQPKGGRDQQRHPG